jgi:DNA replication initiation complex subunit (GINS family)
MQQQHLSLTSLCVIVGIVVVANENEKKVFYDNPTNLYEEEENIYEEIIKIINKNNIQYNKFSETNMYSQKCKSDSHPNYAASKPIRIPYKTNNITK